MRLRLLSAALVLSLLAPAVEAQEAAYGVALHGNPKYPADFKNFDYVNPDAPKGGELRLSALGTFDNFNPFIVKGVAAGGSDMVFETLMASDLDEPFSQYGWVAESVTIAPDRTWVSYKLRPEAKFHDGSPITPEDVIFSFEILRDKGVPSYRVYYKDVVKIEKIGTNEVKFIFKDNKNNELPLIVGQLPVFSKKYWQGKNFAATTLDKIMGSGPYEIDSFDQGRSITYRRVKDWWGKDLPVNKGRYNYDTVTIDYYRDSTVDMEAFLAGRYDIRNENIAKNWALAYNTPAVQQGLIKKLVLKNELPSPAQGFVFNIRRPIFQDRRVREALNYAFDFEWVNKNVAYGAYERTKSYFDNSDMAETGIPTGSELALLQPYKDKLPPELFTTPFTLPKTDGSGDDRDNLHKAADLLKEAGWTLKDGRLVDASGKQFTFEILEDEPAFERWLQPYIANLARLGIATNIRSVDVSQYQNRLTSFDYDMTVNVYPPTLSPGNEQLEFWGSEKADEKGSRNLIGVKDPVVDALLAKLLQANTREDLVTVTHALDRVLQWQYYMIPNWHIGAFRIAEWDKFGMPKVSPLYGVGYTDIWWIDPNKLPKIDAAQHRNH